MSASVSRYKLAVFNSHPIQYFAPLYRKLASQTDIDLTVYYGSRQGVEPGRFDPGFGADVVWNVPLLEGYAHEFLPNIGGDRGVNGFFTQVIPSIVSRLRKGRFDALIVHGHNSATNLMAIAAGKLYGTRVLMRGETHLLLERGRLRSALRGPLMTQFYKLCDGCLYIGSGNRAYYAAHGVPSDRLFFVPYTVDNDRFGAQADLCRPDAGALRRKFGISPDSLLILFASKLIERKRPMDLVQALARLLQSGIAAELMFVGSGALENALKNRVSELQLPGVHFAGFVNQGDLPTYFAASDVFVLPSVNEPWGLIVNEAMSAGLPIVTTREVGAAADLVKEGETGYVYDGGDITSLVAILSLLARDDALRTKLGRNARALMRGWSYDQCVDGIRASLRSGGAPRG